ncbi:ADP-ribosylation factor-like protein 13B [Glossina fuscipes fuscipes]
MVKTGCGYGNNDTRNKCWCCCWYCYCCCCCSCNNNRPHNSVGLDPEKKMRILLLGLAGSGKTEIAHQLIKAKRHDYQATNGAHSYNIIHSDTVCSLTEIGGNEDMQKIWHHYYVGTMALIYCFDMSTTYTELKRAFCLLNEILQNCYMSGKPVLLVATKSDIVDESIQWYDIENTFQMEAMARTYGSTIKLCYSNVNTDMARVERNFNLNLMAGIDWLFKYLLDNFSIIQMRLNCDRNMQNWEVQRNKLIAEGKLNLRKYQRFPRRSSRQKIWRYTHKHLRHSSRRPRTAPAASFSTWSTAFDNQRTMVATDSHNYRSASLETTNSIPVLVPNAICNGDIRHPEEITTGV